MVIILIVDYNQSKVYFNKLSIMYAKYHGCQLTSINKV